VPGEESRQGHRRALVISHGDLTVFLQRPISVTFHAMAALLTAL
jgi:TctA family transporter